MDNTKKIVDLLHVQQESCSKCAKHSKEPNDGSFIEKNPNDSFSTEGTERYGEVQDVDDL